MYYAIVSDILTTIAHIASIVLGVSLERMHECILSRQACSTFRETADIKITKEEVSSKSPLVEKVPCNGDVNSDTKTAQ